MQSRILSAFVVLIALNANIFKVLERTSTPALGVLSPLRCCGSKWSVLNLGSSSETCKSFGLSMFFYVLICFDLSQLLFGLVLTI
jgi:hypothetical protein